MLPLCRSIPFARRLAIATLIGSTLLVSPRTPAHANPAASAPPQLAQNATSHRDQRLEQRVTKLHAALKITPDEEPLWSSVAQVMRDNDAAMEKLVAEKRAQTPGSQTALDDLTTYQAFAQAHVDGLKNLIAAFTTLYNSMPDAQKKTADHVFQNFGRQPGKKAQHHAS